MKWIIASPKGEANNLIRRKKMSCHFVCYPKGYWSKFRLQYGLHWYGFYMGTLSSRNTTQMAFCSYRNPTQMAFCSYRNTT
jgi:hypothetical protein